MVAATILTVCVVTAIPPRAVELLSGGINPNGGLKTVAPPVETAKTTDKQTLPLPPKKQTLPLPPPVVDTVLGGGESHHSNRRNIPPTVAETILGSGGPHKRAIPPTVVDTILVGGGPHKRSVPPTAVDSILIGGGPHRSFKSVAVEEADP